MSIKKPAQTHKSALKASACITAKEGRREVADICSGRASGTRRLDQLSFSLSFRCMGAGHLPALKRTYFSQSLLDAWRDEDWRGGPWINLRSGPLGSQRHRGVSSYRACTCAFRGRVLGLFLHRFLASRWCRAPVSFGAFLLYSGADDACAWTALLFSILISCLSPPPCRWCQVFSSFLFFPCFVFRRGLDLGSRFRGVL